MFERVKRWLDSAAAPVHAPSSGAVARTAADRCLEAYRRGLAQFQAGELAVAEEELNRALGYRHDLAEAHYYLGLIYRKQAKLEDASDALVMATAFKPDFAQAWLFLGIVALDRGQFDTAEESLATALRLKPDYPEAYNSLGSLFAQRKQFHDAAVNYRKAIELNPRFALAHSNLAHVTLREEFDAETALAHVQTALELDPQLAGAHNNLAMILQFQGRCEEALAACERALELNPGFAGTLMVRALAQLMLGEFAGGWRDYEARRELLPTFRVRKFPYREWDGSPLAGQSLLVYNEQGIGDEIMFASCLPDLLALGAACVVECSAKLEHLFRRSFPAADLIVSDQAQSDMSYLQALPRFDWQVAAGSLPLRLRRSWEDFARRGGYLVADPARIAFWKERLRRLGPGRKIGLSWRGGSHYTNRSRRSIDLERLLPVLEVPDLHVVSLQYTDCNEEIASVCGKFGVTIHHWQEAVDDYDETAALVCALDLVISVQTAVIHLAGALGRPAWALVPSTPEWRYMARGTRMPWYPSVRIFRQAPGSDWKMVITDVRQELMTVQHESPGGGAGLMDTVRT